MRGNSVLFLTQYFPPETGAPQVRISEMARLLAQKGYRVQVLTALPSYPKGSFFEGYRHKIFMREEMNEIPVLRTWIYPTKSASLMPRLFNYLSFALSSVLIGSLFLHKPDVIITESPPLFLGLSGHWLKRLFRCKHILNVSDLWPETAIAMGYLQNKKLLSAAERLEMLLYRKTDAQTGQSYGIVRGIKQKHPKARVILIPNGCDCEVFHPTKRDRSFLSASQLGEKIIVGYAGLIGLAQGITIMMQVAENFKNDHRIAFVVVGDGPERESLEREARERGLNNLVFTGLTEKSRMPGIVAGFDMTIIPLRYEIPGALPSKIYEAMASKVPIILAAKGDPKELIERSEAGIVVDYDDIESVASGVKRLLEDPGLRTRLAENGYTFVRKFHRREIIAEKMAAVIESVLTSDWREFEKSFPAERMN